jgi:hypothetical protein
VGGGDLTGAEFDGGEDPGFADEIDEAGGEEWLAGVSGAESIDGAGAVGSQFGGIDTGEAKDVVEVGAGCFEDFGEPVFDFDVVVGARQAQSGGRFEGAGGGGVEFADK